MPLDDATMEEATSFTEGFYKSDFYTSFMEGYYRGVRDGLDDARRILNNVDGQISETRKMKTTNQMRIDLR